MDPASVGFFEAISPADAGGFPSPGVRGCFLSHLAVLEGDIAFSRKVLATPPGHPDGGPMHTGTSSRWPDCSAG